MGNEYGEGDHNEGMVWRDVGDVVSQEGKLGEVKFAVLCYDKL